MLRQIIPTIFLFITSQLKHGKSSIGITYIRELLFYYAFFCNGKTRFMHVNKLQKQLL